jgi:hypothetical protein
MYINRRGLVDNLRFKGVVKTMSSDAQSMLIVMANDVQNVSEDLIEELKETRMSFMIFSMKMRGLVPPFQTPAERLKNAVASARLPDFSGLRSSMSRLSRIPAAVSSVMAVLLFFHR